MTDNRMSIDDFERVTTLTTEDKIEFIHYLNKFTANINSVAQLKGFWNDYRRYSGKTGIDDTLWTRTIKSEKLMLIVTELAEAQEALREGDPLSDKEELANQGISLFAEEMADVIIRVLDLCFQFDVPIADVLLSKHEQNKKRDYKHGKAF
jgi:NTP pyrophosphatase (non-canonical NTP hydrolase)